MKELSIEEKAQRYDEAIEIAKSNYDTIVGMGENCTFAKEGIVNTFHHIFPELKESEDEKIRETLIENFKWFCGDYPETTKWGKDDNLLVKDIIAWLEKKGTSYTKRDVNDAYLKGVTDTKNEIEKQYEANYQIRKDIGTFIFNYRGDIKDRAKWKDYLGIMVSFVEKQGKQKETLCDKCKKTQPSHSCQDITALGRCALEKQDEQKSKGNSALEALNEEKVDNANKVEPKFKVGDVMRTTQEAADGIKGGMPVVVSIDEEYYHCNNELIAIKDQDNYEYPPMNRRQKPAWSEMDKTMVRCITSDLELLKNRGDGEASKAAYQGEIKWLKSLKNRYTWKPSDEQMNTLRHVISGCSYDIEPLVEIEEQLKKLKG